MHINSNKSKMEIQVIYKNIQWGMVKKNNFFNKAIKGFNETKQLRNYEILSMFLRNE